jgi:hypothetical protein
MSTKIYCTQCGAAIDKSVTICDVCGNAIESVDDSSPNVVIIREQPTYLRQPPPQQAYYQPVYRNQNPLGQASLITSIVGIVLVFLPYLTVLSPLCFLAGLITGIIGISKENDKGFAISGLVISIIGILMSIFFIVFVFWIFIPFIYW